MVAHDFFVQRLVNLSEFLSLRKYDINKFTYYFVSPHRETANACREVQNFHRLRKSCRLWAVLPTPKHTFPVSFGVNALYCVDAPTTCAISSPSVLVIVQSIGRAPVKPVTGHVSIINICTSY